jgi:hypothetical protein
MKDSVHANQNTMKFLLGILIFIGVECKRTDTPRLTPSIRNAVEDLGLKHVLILYPGTRRFPLSDQVEAVPVHAVVKDVSLFE